MYVLVDREQMAITHKHHDRAVLADLSWIECTGAGLQVALSSARVWTEFSATELKKLYKAATGADLPGYGPGLAQAVFDMAKRLPVTVVNAAEVRAQRLTVSDGDKAGYQYAPGQQVPTQHRGGYVPAPLQIARDSSEELRAANSANTYTRPATPSQGTPQPFANTSTSTAAPAAPRAGGVKETVYRIADAMWEEAGKPSGLKDVLELRKSMMNVLEAEHGIKKTTSSTTLGGWQKERIN